MRKLRVLVLMGGKSSERKVSLMTGRQVVKFLDRSKYEVRQAEMGGQDWVDKVLWSEIVFIAMHGIYGEDGRIQGFLDCLGKRYTGSGVRASVIGMDKLLFRAVMEKVGVRMPRLADRAPCVVKPVNQGSSVGVSIVKTKKGLRRAVSLAKRYGGGWLAEEYVKGVEVSCGVLRGEVLPIIEICPKNEFFDYEAKYSSGRCEEIVPARLSRRLTKEVQKTTRQVYEAVGCRGMARVDMIVRDRQVYVLEINTIPGLTKNSLLPKEAGAAGLSYAEMLDKIIQASL